MSGDVDRANQAAKEVLAEARRPGGPKVGNTQILLDAGRFAEVESASTELILVNADSSAAVAALQKLHTQALLGEGKTAAALSSAKAYYEVCPYRQTVDAIYLVSACLEASHPQDHGLVNRFKRQQMVGASTQPTAVDVGEPVLAAIQIDSSTLNHAIDAVNPTDFGSCIAKGNLLLLADRAKEAHSVCQQAYAMAHAGQEAIAIESMARAIRAESGCVGPANIFILSERQKVGP